MTENDWVAPRGNPDKNRQSGAFRAPQRDRTFTVLDLTVIVHRKTTTQ
jgi:hypothetical protein